jgi:hypothetical protein
MYNNVDEDKKMTSIEVWDDSDSGEEDEFGSDMSEEE